MKSTFTIYMLTFMMCTQLLAQTKPYKSFCYTEPSLAKAIPSQRQAMGSQNSLSCHKYVVRVYFHFVKMDGNPGYSVSHISTILDHLNSTYNGTGISFINAGDRNWYSTTWGNTATPVAVFGDGAPIFNDPNLSPQPNAINLYILPNNVQASGGKGLINNNRLFVAGTRLVEFNCIHMPYEIPHTCCCS